MTTPILLPPVNLNSPQFGGGDIHTEDHAEGRDYVRLPLKTFACGADRQKIIGIRRVLGVVEEMISSTCGERLVCIR
jgi:hypothetical protein